MMGFDRLRLMTALALALCRAPAEAVDLLDAPRVPHTPEKPTLKTADELEVEMPATVIRTDHAAHAIIKARNPAMNRKQRRQLAHQMQARATNLRRK